MPGPNSPLQRLWEPVIPGRLFRLPRGRGHCSRWRMPPSAGSESDWLVASMKDKRALTAFNSKTGGFQLTTVGACKRPRARGKGPANLSRGITGSCRPCFAARRHGWGAGLMKNLPGTKKDNDPDLKAERILGPQTSRGHAPQCVGQRGHVTEETKPSTQLSPLLYKLTSLQRDADGRFGYSAENSARVSPVFLMNEHRLPDLSGDSRALPRRTVRTTRWRCIRRALPPVRGAILKQQWLRPTSAVRAQVSDRFTIIPTSSRRGV